MSKDTANKSGSEIMKTKIKLTASEKKRKSQTFNMEWKKKKTTAWIFSNTSQQKTSGKKPSLNKRNSIPQGYSELFLCPKAQKNIFLHLNTKLSIYYLSYSIYTQDPFDIVNLSNMQDTCHMWTKRWPSTALCPCGSGLENRRAESEDLRLSFSWGLRTFPFS